MTPTAGLGFKLQHLDEVLAGSEPGLQFEAHAENYMVDGGARLAALLAVRERFPISLHGVGLSLVSTTPPDPDHLERLARLVDRTQPFLVSDHLAWQRWNGSHHADFLPFPRTKAALAHTIENVDRVQSRLGRTMLVENPSLYVDLPGHELTEPEFLVALARATGCGILLDVNNVFVSARNLGFDPADALCAIPADLVGEIHLAGHSADSDPASELLIDSHGAQVADEVWSLYQQLIARIGQRPPLIERDNDVPAFAALMDERAAAHAMLSKLAPVDA